jgi:hypothetical protein
MAETHYHGVMKKGMKNKGTWVMAVKINHFYSYLKPDISQVINKISLPPYH